MVGKSAEEFPKLPEQKPLTTLEMETQKINDMIVKTIYAVSNDLTRPALCGVLWEIGKDNITMVATDGHRLSKIVDSGEYEDLGGKNFSADMAALGLTYAGKPSMHWMEQ